MGTSGLQITYTCCYGAKNLEIFCQLRHNMSNEIYILTGCRAVYLEVDIIFNFEYFVFISRFRYDI